MLVESGFRVREWLSPSEMAGVLGVTASAVRQRARAGGWDSRRRAQGKGGLYHVSKLSPAGCAEWVRRECEAYLVARGVDLAIVPDILRPISARVLMGMIATELLGVRDAR